MGGQRRRECGEQRGGGGGGGTCLDAAALQLSLLLVLGLKLAELLGLALLGADARARQCQAKTTPANGRSEGGITQCSVAAKNGRH